MRGWTCDPDSYSTSIWVHVYANGAYVGATQANVSHEQGVSDRCGGTQYHRFIYDLPDGLRNGVTRSYEVYGIGVNSSGVQDDNNARLDANPRSLACCSLPGAPGALSVSCNSAGNQATVSWGAAANASYYSLRADASYSSWPGGCPGGSESGTGPGDFCRSPIYGTSYTFNVTPNVGYDVWVHSRADCDPNYWSPTSRRQFTCVPASTPTSTPVPPTPTLTPTPPPTPPPPTAPPAGCSITTSPSMVWLQVGDSDTVTANISTTQTVTEVRFGSYNTSVATVSPTSTSGRTTMVTGVAPGDTAVWATAFLSNGQRCDTPGGNDTDVGVRASPPTPTLPMSTPQPTGVPPTLVPSPTPLPTPTPTPPVCGLPEPEDPPLADCATSSITWRWCEVPGANSYEADILTWPSGSYIDNDWWPPAPPNINCGIPDSSCNTGRACEYATGPNMPDGSYQSAIRARNTANACTVSDWATSSIVRLACTTSHFAGGGGGGIIAALGPLRSLLPPFGPPPYFIDDALSSGIPGLPVGREVTVSTISGNQVNSRGWVVINPYNWTSLTVKPENTYQYMAERIMARAAPVVVGSGAIETQGQWDALVGGAGSGNRITLAGGGGEVTVLRRQGDLAFNTGVTADAVAEGRRVLVLVEGDVTINGRLHLEYGSYRDPGDGFLAILASGNITIGSGVGETNAAADIRLENYPPHLEGIFYAGGTFDTGGGANKLRVDGTVVGYNGVRLGREYRGKDPAEYFMFRPDLTVTLHRVGLRKKIFQELLVP